MFGMLLLCAGHLACGDLITNGGFESGDFSGWTVTPAGDGGGEVFVIPLAAHSGNFGAAFGAVLSDLDSISQTFVTVPGSFYDLSFFYEVRKDEASPDNAFRVLFGGVVVYENLNAAPSFGELSFHLVATSSSTTLEFQGRNAPSFDFLDDVSLNASSVPEPENAALILLGLGLIFVGARLKSAWCLTGR